MCKRFFCFHWFFKKDYRTRVRVLIECYFWTINDTSLYCLNKNVENINTVDDMYTNDVASLVIIMWLCSSTKCVYLKRVFTHETVLYFTSWFGFLIDYCPEYNTGANTLDTVPCNVSTRSCPDVLFLSKEVYKCKSHSHFSC